MRPLEVERAWGPSKPLLKEQMKHLVAITIALLPSAALAQQFTPQQMLDVMTKSPSNRDVRVHDMDVYEDEDEEDDGLRWWPE